MNEQRQQAYLNLIQRLLNSPSGEVPQILQANRELLDADFLQMMDAETQRLSQQGNENAANWLRNLAVELGEALNLASPTVANPSEQDLQAYGQFLSEVLQATEESGGDARVVYSLLVQNTAYLNPTLAELLRHWVTTTLPEMQPDVAQYIAVNIVNFSSLIQQFPLGDKASNMEIAIAGYEGVLTLFTRDALPQQWATTQNNLGEAYRNRIVGDKAQNLELAIASFTAALQVYTRDAFPQDWAMTQYNLGNVYRDRILGNKRENLELAIKSFTNALLVYTPTIFPQNHVETLFNLGIVYQESDRLISAYLTLESAIETVKFLRGKVVTGDETKHKPAEDWNKLYHSMIEVCIKLGEYSEAIEYIELTKTQNIMELMFKRIDLEIEEEKTRLKELEKNKKQNINLKNLRHLRQQREYLTSRVIRFNSIHFNELKNLLDKDTTIIQFYIFANYFRAFIITRDKEQPDIWQSEAQDLDKLQNWTNDYLQLYSNDKQRWRFCLNDKLHQLAEILHIQDILKHVPTQCQKVILVPHRYLHLLPLHALPLSSEKYLIDKFPKGVSYAPSCQLWRLTQTKAQTLSNAEFRHLFAIQNPTDNLEFTNIEVETIATAFHPHHILEKSQATITALAEPPTAENLRNAHWLHFSCHGYFNFNVPEKSALQLADSEISPLPVGAESSRYLRISDDAGIDLDKCLTLEGIFQLSFPNCRLVTLSACETGLVDVRSNSDEYIGLSSGFIRAGAASIISSLWAVDDFSTALLMIKFYENLHPSTRNVALALNQAQQWFRQVTQRELLQWLDGKTEMDAQQKQKVKQRLADNYRPEQQPFKKPEFWAAFCAIGE